MARVSPSEYAEKWNRRLKASTEDIRRGVNKVTTAPGQLAAQSVDLMLNRLMEAIQSGLWAEQVSAVTLDEWKKAMVDKGITRIASGVDAASQSQVQMAQKLLEAVDQAAARANALPKGTLEDSINRMNTFVREMHKNRIRKPRR